MSELNEDVDFGAISDEEKALAAKALRAFCEGDTQTAQSKLAQLREKRPNDIKVLHNCLVASSSCSDPLDVMSSLEQLAGTSDIDEVDWGVALMNLAILNFRQQRFHQTQELLEKLTLMAESLGEALLRDVLFLYIETCLKLNYPEKVPKLIATLENLLFNRGLTTTGSAMTGLTRPVQEASPPRESRRDKSRASDHDTSTTAERKLEWKPIVNQYRVRCLLALRSLKVCKREVKNLNGENKDREDKEGMNAVMSAFARAQLEHHRDCGRKAVKILNTLSGKPVLASRHLATIYYNNMAAVHFKAGKMSLAVMYARHAVKEYGLQVKSGAPHQTRTFFDLLYNMAVCKLFCGGARSAFDDFVGCARLIGSNPLVWMRLAECGLMVHAEFVKKHLKKQRLVCAQVGHGIHRRIILTDPLAAYDLPADTPDDDISNANNDDTSNENPGVGEVKPTLQFAVRALKICLALIAESELRLEAMATPEDGTPCASALQELRLLNSSALCASAYAALCVGDFVAAQAFCESLLVQERLSPAQRALAHLYCGEALLLQDQLSEAVEHLSLDNAEELIVAPPHSEENETQWSVRPSMPWLPRTLRGTRRAFQYNLAVAFALREELHKAEEALRPLLDEADATDGQLSEQLLWLVIYLHIQQGRPDKAKQIIRKHLLIVACT